MKSLLHGKFYSNLPMAAGPKQALKLELWPCSTNIYQFMLPQNDLHRKLLAFSLSQGDACFDIMAQEYVNEKTTPIEDSTSIWNVPYIKLGRLNIEKQGLDISGQFCDATSFNSAHAISVHQPLGPIHRVRASVYTEMGFQRCMFANRAYKEPAWNDVLQAKATLNGFSVNPAHVFAEVARAERLIKEKPYLEHFSPK